LSFQLEPLIFYQTDIRTLVQESVCSIHRILKCLPNPIGFRINVAYGAELLPIITKSMKPRSAKTSQESLQPPPNPRLVSLLSELAPRDGFLPSRLPDVSFMRTTRHIPRTPITYEPGIFIMAQGRKTGYLGDKRFVYDASHYLVLSVPMPFECETRGSPEAPMLAVRVGVTPAAVTELLMQMEHLEPASGSQPQAMEATALDDILRGATIRLLESLRSADESRILGPQIVREIIYHVLRGKLGPNLRAPRCARQPFRADQSRADSHSLGLRPPL
jgi:hypothetical protein